MPVSERRLAFLAVLLGCGLCVLLFAAGEGVARWRVSRIPPASVPSGVEHPPYYNNPGVETSPRAFGFHLTYRINKDGLRGPEVPPKGKATRVLVLGDSLVFGAFAREDETLPAQLERLLRSGGQEWQVLNGGVSSYDAWDYAGFLRLKGLAFEPDIVIVGLYMNDHIARKAFVETTKAKSAPRRRLLAKVRDLVFKSELVNAGMYWLQRHQDPRRPRLSVAKPLRDEDRQVIASYFPGDKATAKAVEAFLTDYRYDAGLAKDTLPWLLDLEAWNSIEAPLKEVRALCASKGIKVMAVVFPVQFETVPGYSWPQPHAHIADLLKKAGIPAVDLLPLYRNHGADSLYPMRYDIAHPSAPGYTIAAEAVHAELARLGWTGKR